MNLHLVI